MKTISADGHLLEHKTAPDGSSYFKPLITEIENATPVDYSLSDELADTFHRDGIYARHARNRAGEILTREALKKRNDSAAKLEEQTLGLALKLSKAGESAFLVRKSGDRVYSKVFPDIEKVDSGLGVRRWSIFPQVAAMRRAPMLKDLEDHCSKFSDTVFITLTSGPRLIVNTEKPGELRTALSEFHRRISNLNARTLRNGTPSLFGRFGFALDYRATELGTVEKLPDGRLSIHIHAHAFGRFEAKSQAWPRRVWLRSSGRKAGHRRNVPAVDYSRKRVPRWKTLLRLRRLHADKLGRVAYPRGKRLGFYLRLARATKTNWNKGAALPFAARWKALLRLRRFHSGELGRVAYTRGKRLGFYLRLARAARARCARRECFFGLLWPVWGYQWDFGNVVNQVHEACKYTIKPGDYEALAPQDVAYLRREMAGMKMVVAFRDLKAARRKRRGKAWIGRKWRDENSEEKNLILRFGPCHNAKGPRDLKKIAEKAKLALEKRVLALRRWLLVAAFTEGVKTVLTARHCIRSLAARRLLPRQIIPLAASLLACGRGQSSLGPARRAEQSDPCRRAARLLLAVVALRAQAEKDTLRARSSAGGYCDMVSAFSRVSVELCRVPAPIEEQKRGEELKRKEEKPKNAPRKNHVVARMSPHAHFDRITRPAFLVENFNGDFEALRQNPVVARALAATAAQIKEAEQIVRFEDVQLVEEMGRPLIIQSSHLTHNCLARAHARDSQVLEVQK
jgi:hypothetical protein